MTPAFNTHQPRAGSRAVSAHHTEAGAKRDNGLWISWDTSDAPAFCEGDCVVVVDPQSKHYNREGVVSQVISSTRYTVRFPDGMAQVFLFRARQLRKIGVNTAPQKLFLLPEYSSVLSWNDRDYFQCDWGKFKLKDHPHIHERFIAHQKRQFAKRVKTTGVVLLPAVCESTIQDAHQRYVEFMRQIGYQSLLDDIAMPPAEPQEEMGILDTIMAQEAAKARSGSKTPKQATPRPAAPKQHENRVKQARRPLRLDTGLRIRKVAA